MADVSSNAEEERGEREAEDGEVSPLITRNNTDPEDGDDNEGPYLIEWGFPFCLEVDSCCGCCDVQVGTKVIAIMGVVQGVTHCMAISTAGFLAAPTLLTGCLSIAFGLYGFWGAQKPHARKIRIYFYWLFIVCALLGAICTARVYTSKTFCEKHNCIVDHMYYPSEHANAPEPKRMIIPSSKAETSLFVVHENNPANHKLVSVEKSDTSSATKTTPEAPPVPVFQEPCYVQNKKPSLKVCREAHNLSAIATIIAIVPLNLFFLLIVRSLYLKVLRNEILPEQVERWHGSTTSFGRPIQVVQQIPPLTVYEATSLDGAPTSGRYFKPPGQSNDNANESR